MPGAAEALAAVAAHVPVAVATTKPRAFAEPLCERLGLSPSLTAVCGPELDAPEEVKTTTVRRALEALGLAPGADAPLVGDRAMTPRPPAPTASAASASCGASATRPSSAPRAPTRSSPRSADLGRALSSGGSRVD